MTRTQTRLLVIAHLLIIGGAIGTVLLVWKGKL